MTVQKLLEVLDAVTYEVYLAPQYVLREVLRWAVGQTEDMSAQDGVPVWRGGDCFAVAAAPPAVAVRLDCRHVVHIYVADLAAPAPAEDAEHVRKVLEGFWGDVCQVQVEEVQRVSYWAAAQLVGHAETQAEEGEDREVAGVPLRFRLRQKHETFWWTHGDKLYVAQGYDSGGPVCNYTAYVAEL